MFRRPHPAPLLPLLTLLSAGCPAPAPRGPAPLPTEEPPAMTRAVQVQGHRGCRGLRPENTMAAFRHAIALGVDVLELDLGLTADGVLLVTHDPQINPKICRLTAKMPSNRYRDLTWIRVQTLDCGALHPPRFPEQRPQPGARIPRLEQVLDLLAEHPGLGANIEIKTDPEEPELTLPPARFAEALVPLLRRRELLDRVTVQSFDPRALEAVRGLEPRLRLAALVDELDEEEPMLARSGARILSPKHTLLTAARVAAWQRRGLAVIPWTVNDPGRMRELIAWGVDGIITDYPDRLLALLDR